MGRNLCGPRSYRAQHVTWHEGVNAACWDFRAFVCLTYSPCHLSDIRGVKYLFPVRWQVAPSKDWKCSFDGRLLSARWDEFGGTVLELSGHNLVPVLIQLS